MTTLNRFRSLSLTRFLEEVEISSYFWIVKRLSGNDTDLPGKPDIVLSKFKAIIFVHGCFWHRHTNCRYAYMPKSKQEFWETKFKSNVERDNKVRKQLEDYLSPD